MSTAETPQSIDTTFTPPLADTERQTAGDKVLWHFTMSLDGFVAGPNHTMDWMTGISFRPGLVEEYVQTTGAVLGGRDGWDAVEGDSRPYGGAWHGPIFVLTHHLEDAAPAEGVTFLNCDPAEAVRIGLDAAGGKNLEVFSPTIGRQLLDLGLIDEIDLHIAPVLLGEGIRLHDKPGGAPIRLNRIGVGDPTSAVNVRYRPATGGWSQAGPGDLTKHTHETAYDPPKPGPDSAVTHMCSPAQSTRTAGIESSLMTAAAARVDRWVRVCGLGAIAAALPTVIWRVIVGAGVPRGTPNSWRRSEALPGSGTSYVLTLSAIQLAAALLTLVLIVPNADRVPRWSPIAARSRLPAGLVVGISLTGSAMLTVLCVTSALNWGRVDPFRDAHTTSAWSYLCWACYLVAVAWPALLAATTIGYWRIRRQVKDNRDPVDPRSVITAPSPRRPPG